jgi:hypothetical protein
MNPEQTTWERVDLPALCFVASCDYRAVWRFNKDDEPSDEIPALTNTELDGSLRRLEGYDLIRGDRGETFGNFSWSRLRPTSDGWRVLGEWAASERVRHGGCTRGDPAGSR